MKFSSTSDNQGIIEVIDDLCDTNSTSFPTSRKLAYINAEYEKVIGTLIANRGQWDFDDSNYTTFPIGTIDLVNSQNDYPIDETFLVIERVEVKDSDSIWHVLEPLDRRKINVAVSEFFKDDGIPQYYDKTGSSLNLYPAPATGSVTLTAGLKVFFQRTASLFTASDTTKEPGFSSPYHMILAYAGAIPYCMKYKKDRVALYEKKKDDLWKEMLDFEAAKEKDVKPRMEMRGIAHR